MSSQQFVTDSDMLLKIGGTYAIGLTGSLTVAQAETAGMVTAALAMDSLLAETGAAFRSLAMPSFMENSVRQAGVMREKGLFFGPLRPDRKGG